MPSFGDDTCSDVVVGDCGVESNFVTATFRLVQIGYTDAAMNPTVGIVGLRRQPDAGLIPLLGFSPFLN